MTDTKQCSKCGQMKPCTFEYFYHSKDSADGFRPDCRACFRTPEQRERKNAHDRVRRASDSAYRERRREIKRRYRANMAPERRERELVSMRERARQWGESMPPEQREARRKQSRRRYIQGEYGLTDEQYQALWEAQGGLCAVCRRRFQKLQIDHCHETGAVRGLLCGNCNFAIGRLGDTPAALMRAVNYLRDAQKRQQLTLQIEDAPAAAATGPTTRLRRKAP